MAQTIFADINPNTTSGTQLAGYLNDFKAALLSGLSGTARPTELLAGGAWLDTSLEDTPTTGAGTWSYKIYTGTVDLEVYKVDLATGGIIIAGSESQFAITKISADTVGALAKLIKQRIANNGQVLAGDVLGEYQFVGRGSDSSNPVMARIKAVVSENVDASHAGGYLVFEAISAGGTTLTEIMRLVNGNVGIGTTAPSTALHVVATSGGIKFERAAEDASAAKLITRKRRLSGTGAPMNADLISQIEMNSTDDASAEFTAARIEAAATEDHTATTKGTSLTIYTTPTGSATRTAKLFLGDASYVKGAFQLEAQTLEQQSVATTGTPITALSAAKSIVHFTGSTATTVQGVNATHISKVVLIHNGSTAAVTIKHEDSGATATNRFKLPLGRDIVVTADSSVEVFYDTVDTRWKLKSGSGSGSGGSYATGSVLTITSGGTITTTTVDGRQMIKIKGSSGGVTASATPFGTGGGWTDGSEFLLVGQDLADTVIITKSDVAKGVIGNFDSVEVALGTLFKVVYDSGLDRFIYQP